MPQLRLSLPVTDPVLIVAIAMTIFLVAPMVMQRLRVPGIIGIIVAGAAVGPNALNLLDRSTTIVLLGTVGLLYLVFMAGTEIDLHGFRRYRNRSLAFGTISYLLPQAFGIGVGIFLGYGLAASILLASMFGSHTLVAYPVATRLGIAKNEAVTSAVGGTIVTDSAALLVLAVVAASTLGTLDTLFWVRLVVLLGGYLALIWLGLPRLARWFFRNERTGGAAEFVFVLAALFTGAHLAALAGIQPIVGAFFVGLALNRLIPDQSLLNNRIRFVGETVFIPFFLLSVGMLVDLRVLAGDLRAWEVMIGMTLTVVITKAVAAKLTERAFGYSSAEGWTMYGLSVPQAAATLAATLVGIEVGLFDDAVLNGAVMMILLTCILGPSLVEKFGREVALQEEQKPFEPGLAPQRILVPMAKPATAKDLMDLALVIRDPDSSEPIYPITVFPADQERSSELVTSAEKMLSHAVAYAAGADVPVVPLTRMDYNFASGIARGIAETRTTTVIIGWDGRRTGRRVMFGSVLDQLLEQTKQQVLVAKLGHPLNTTERIVLIVPHGADHAPGYPDSIRTLKLMANRLGAVIHGLTVDGAGGPYRKQFEAVRPQAPVSFEETAGWGEALDRLQTDLRPDDLVVVLAARRGTIGWDDALERLPSRLARLGPESFLMLYPAETGPARRQFGDDVTLPRGLAPDRVLFDVPQQPFADLLRTLLETEFAADRDVLHEILTKVVENAEAMGTEIRNGVVVTHARAADLEGSLLFLAISQAGIEFPHAATPARLVFVLVTPEEEPEEQMIHLAEISQLVSDPARRHGLLETRTLDDLLRVAPTYWPA